MHAAIRIDVIVSIKPKAIIEVSQLIKLYIKKVTEQMTKTLLIKTIEAFFLISL